jgi:predicted esterase
MSVLAFDERSLARSWFKETLPRRAPPPPPPSVDKRALYAGIQKEKKEKKEKAARPETQRLSPAGPKQVVLMLHGFTQSAAVFEKRCANLQKKALKALNLEARYLQGPHECPSLYAASDRPIAGQQAWFVPGEMEAETRPVRSTRFDGWEQALTGIERAVAEAAEAGDQVVGVVGFSQGAMMAALLLARQTASLSDTTLRFGVLIGSGDINDPAPQALLEGGLAAAARRADGARLPPCVLCIGGASDPLAPVAACRLLARRLGGHNNGDDCSGASAAGDDGNEACGEGVWLREVSGGHGIPPNNQHAAVKAFINWAMAWEAWVGCGVPGGPTSVLHKNNGPV